MDYLKFKIKYLKSLVSCFFILSLLLSFWAYFELAEYLNKNNFEYCETNFCLPLLQLGDFLPILISILGLVVVVISIDSWKDGQRYNERREQFIKTKTSTLMVKEELILSHASKLITWDDLKFITLLGKLSNCFEEMQDLNICVDLLNNLESDRGKFFKCVTDFLTCNGVSSDNDIKLATSCLIDSLQACLEDIDEKHKNFKL